MAEQSDAKQGLLSVEISRLMYFSIAMILVSGAILSFLMHDATNRFRSQDSMPELLSVTPDSLHMYGDNPGVVHVGMYIKDFAEFDLLTNKFEFSAILWFLYDPAIISLETLSKFSFERGEIVSQSAPSTRLVGGKLLARYNIRVRFKTNLTYALFPFDSHTLFITLDNNYVSPGELIFESSHNDFILSPEIVTTGWNLHTSRVYTGYSVSRLVQGDSSSDVPHPRVIFAIEYAHSGVRQALTILLPLIFIFFMSIFSLAFTKENWSRALAITSATATALLAYRFVIENLSPKVGYFMISDYLFFLLLAAVFIVFFASVTLQNIPEQYKRVVIIIIHLAVLASFFYLLNF